MALPAPIQALYDRLTAFYNGNAYDASSNPGGFARGGNQANAANALGNFIAAMRDFAAFGKVVAESGQGSAENAAAAAQSAQNAATSEANAKASADRAQTWDPTNYATKASPALTGNPTAPTAAEGDSDTTIATTAFVQREAARIAYETSRFYGI